MKRKALSEDFLDEVNKRMRMSSRKRFRVGMGDNPPTAKRRCVNARYAHESMWGRVMKQLRRVTKYRRWFYETAEVARKFCYDNIRLKGRCETLQARVGELIEERQAIELQRNRCLAVIREATLFRDTMAEVRLQGEEWVH